MPQLEYTPTAYELSERAYEIAKSDNLITATATAMVTMNEFGVFDTMLCLQAHYRKPGQTGNGIQDADTVLIMSTLSEVEEAFARFAEKVSSIVSAYKQVA